MAVGAFLSNGDVQPGAQIRLPWRENINLSYANAQTPVRVSWGAISKLSRSGAARELAAGHLAPQAPHCISSTPGQAELSDKKQNLKIEFFFFFANRVLLHLHKKCCQKKTMCMCCRRPAVSRGWVSRAQAVSSHVTQTARLWAV